MYSETPTGFTRNGGREVGKGNKVDVTWTGRMQMSSTNQSSFPEDGGEKISKKWQDVHCKTFTNGTHGPKNNIGRVIRCAVCAPLFGILGRLHKNCFCVTSHFFGGLKCVTKNSVIRDIKLDQKGRNSRHNLKTKQKPCTKVLEIQKLATFDCFPP